MSKFLKQRNVKLQTLRSCQMLQVKTQLGTFDTHFDLTTPKEKIIKNDKKGQKKMSLTGFEHTISRPRQ